MNRFLTAAAICILLISCLYFSSANAQSVDDLILMTESFPPFNFEKDGKLQGISVDLMERMLESLNSRLGRKDIKLLPWARAYRDIIEINHSVLFLMERNKARENLFKWVGPVMPTIYGLIARKDRKIKIKSVDEAKKLRIGVVSKDLGEQLLLERGIGQENIDPAPSGEVNLLKLNNGRIDVWNYEVSVAKWIINQSGFSIDDYETVYIMKKGDSFFAFHRDTDDSLVRQFQQALDKLKKKSDKTHESELDKIINRYLKREDKDPYKSSLIDDLVLETATLFLCSHIHTYQLKEVSGMNRIN